MLFVGAGGVSAAGASGSESKSTAWLLGKRSPLLQHGLDLVGLHDPRLAFLRHLHRVPRQRLAVRGDEWLPAELVAALPFEAPYAIPVAKDHAGASDRALCELGLDILAELVGADSLVAGVSRVRLVEEVSVELIAEFLLKGGIAVCGLPDRVGDGLRRRFLELRPCLLDLVELGQGFRTRLRREPARELLIVEKARPDLRAGHAEDLRLVRLVVHPLRRGRIVRAAGGACGGLLLGRVLALRLGVLPAESGQRPGCVLVPAGLVGRG